MRLAIVRSSYLHRLNMSFFFLQAEDGIRDFHVTGVQTCALPILAGGAVSGHAGDAKSQRSAAFNGKIENDESTSEARGGPWRRRPNERTRDPPRTARADGRTPRRRRRQRGSPGLPLILRRRRDRLWLRLGFRRVRIAAAGRRIVLGDDRRLDLAFDRPGRRGLRLVYGLAPTDLNVRLGRRRRAEIVRRLQPVLLLLAAREDPPGQAEGNQCQCLSHGVSFTQSFAVDSLRLERPEGSSNIHATAGKRVLCEDGRRTCYDSTYGPDALNGRAEKQENTNERRMPLPLAKDGIDRERRHGVGRRGEAGVRTGATLGRSVSIRQQFRGGRHERKDLPRDRIDRRPRTCRRPQARRARRDGAGARPQRRPWRRDRARNRG